MSDQEVPATIEELGERLNEVTLRRFLAAWFDEPNRTSEMEESAAVLDVWSTLSSVGMNPPDWVAVAHAGMHYGSRGIL